MELYDKESLQSKVVKETEKWGLYESVDPPLIFTIRILINENRESLIRLYSVYFLVLFIGLGIVVQIFYLQIFKGEQLKSDANKQIFISKKVLAQEEIFMLQMSKRHP